METKRHLLKSLRRTSDSVNLLYEIIAKMELQLHKEICLYLDYFLDFYDKDFLDITHTDCIIQSKRWVKHVIVDNDGDVALVVGGDRERKIKLSYLDPLDLIGVWRSVVMSVEPILTKD